MKQAFGGVSYLLYIILTGDVLVDILTGKDAVSSHGSQTTNQVPYHSDTPLHVCKQATYISLFPVVLIAYRRRFVLFLHTKLHVRSFNNICSLA
mgnify:CR=1 FL=1